MLSNVNDVNERERVRSRVSRGNDCEKAICERVNEPRARVEKYIATSLYGSLFFIHSFTKEKKNKEVQALRVNEFVHGSFTRSRLTAGSLVDGRWVP